MKTGNVAADQLRSIIERIEKLKEEQAAIGADIKDVFAEAKGNGFDVKAMRKIIALRKMDAAEREEAETILDTYMRALGMQPDLFDEPENAPQQQTVSEGTPHAEIEEENVRASQSTLESAAAAYT